MNGKMDFTLKIYGKLLRTLQSQGFSFYTVSEYAEKERMKTFIKGLNPQFILLRHDVEDHYPNALAMARIQHNLGIRGSYYFRIYPKDENERIIREIAALGHEIGYHYDDLSECKGDYEKALRRFEKNLQYLRQFGPVTSATMEGAPLSEFDNRMLWLGRVKELVGSSEYVEGSTQPEISNQLSATYYILPTRYSDLPKFNYKDFGIKTEPYFDLDFNEIFYLTDTGRCWDGQRFNVRDKALGQSPVTNPEFLKLRFRHTHDIIRAVNEGRFPGKVMMNFHPQRWNDAFFPWLRELVWQNVKNQGKRVLVAVRGRC
jgi:hypothetical protein